MTVYHVETQGDYNALMIELEEKGCEWRWGEKPTKLDKFKIYGKDTYIYEEYGIISLSDGYYSKVYRNNETLIEYKAKGENMEEEEMKHKLQENAFNVSVAVGSLFARGTSAVEADLKEAKSSAKKLIEKIDEYFETLKPKFKVGDGFFTNERNLDAFSALYIIKNLKETYEPKIKMTIEQKDELIQFLDEPDLGFVTFLFCFSGANLYKEFSEKELMRAWLHPELIEVTDD